MSELLRQQQRAKEIKERLYGKSRVVNVAANRNEVIVEDVPEPVSNKPSLVGFFYTDEEFMLKMSEILEGVKKDKENGLVVNSAKELIRRTCEITPFTEEIIRSHKRMGDVSRYRTCMYVFIYNNFPNMSSAAIAKLFDRDSSTMRSLASRSSHRLTRQNYYDQKAKYTIEKIRKNPATNKVAEYIEEKCAENGVTYGQILRQFPCAQLKLKRAIIVNDVFVKFHDFDKHELSRLFNLSDNAIRVIVRSFKGKNPLTIKPKTLSGFYNGEEQVDYYRADIVEKYINALKSIEKECTSSESLNVSIDNILSLVRQSLSEDKTNE